MARSFFHSVMGRHYTRFMLLRPPSIFCSACGSRLTRCVPSDDSYERDCCTQCGAIHYINPRPVVGTIPVWEEKVLLCRRAIEPRHGYWTLPAGFMEVGETTTQGAARETDEEAGARIEIGALFAVFDVPHREQVHLFFLARLLDLNFAPGRESLEVRLFTEDSIPWNELAFGTVTKALRLYFVDRTQSAFGMHHHAFLPEMPPT